MSEFRLNNVQPGSKVDASVGINTPSAPEMPKTTRVLERVPLPHGPNPMSRPSGGLPKKAPKPLQTPRFMKDLDSSLGPAGSNQAQMSARVSAGDGRRDDINGTLGAGLLAANHDLMLVIPIPTGGDTGHRTG